MRIKSDEPRTTVRVPVSFRNHIKIKAVQEHVTMLEYMVKNLKD
jgi:hypothetical protein